MPVVLTKHAKARIGQRHLDPGFITNFASLLGEHAIPDMPFRASWKGVSIVVCRRHENVFVLTAFPKRRQHT